MNEIVKKNEWESKFFNRPIFNFRPGLLSGLNEGAFCQLSLDSLVCCKTASDNYIECDNLSKLGFIFAEGEVVFKKRLVSSQQVNSPEKLNNKVYAKADELQELLVLSDGLYLHSRFREPWFTTKQKDSFYLKWLENAVLGLFDDCCLLVKVGDEIAGFVTLKQHANSVAIGLLGVFPSFQGQGIGKQLLQLAEDYALENGKPEVTVPTQMANTAALKLYSANNYVISNTAYWFYKQV